MFTRWQPFGDVRAEINRLQNEMQQLFGRTGNGAREFSGTSYPPLNMWEDENNYFVEAELPSFHLDDLEMYVIGENQLSIKGKRNEPELDDATWHRQERGYGSFARLVELPGFVDSEKVAATFSNGVLTITLPKKEEAKPRRIEVKTG